MVDTGIRESENTKQERKIFTASDLGARIGQGCTVTLSPRRIALVFADIALWAYTENFDFTRRTAGGARYGFTLTLATTTHVSCTLHSDGATFIIEGVHTQEGVGR